MRDRTWMATAIVSVATHLGALAVLPSEASSAPFVEEIAVSISESFSQHEPEPELEAEPDPPLETSPAHAVHRDEPSPLRQPAAPSRGEAKSPAEAGRVLASEVNDGPGDVADFTMVQGKAAQYAGGVTASRGKSKVAVERVGDPAADPSIAPGGGSAAPDRSRAARPASRAWRCSHLFPKAAGEADVHHAIVTVVVDVGPNGKARRVTVVRDPGHGFASAARACAFGQGYLAALDQRGRPMGGHTAPLSVRFIR